MAFETDRRRPTPLASLVDALAAAAAHTLRDDDVRAPRSTRPRDRGANGQSVGDQSPAADDAAAAQLRALERIEALLAELLRRTEPPHAPAAAAFAWPEL